MLTVRITSSHCQNSERHLPWYATGLGLKSVLFLTIFLQIFPRDDLTLSVTPNAGANFTCDIAGSPTDGDRYVESISFAQSFNAGDLFELSVCQSTPGMYLDEFFTVKALEDSNLIAQFLGVFYNEDCQRFVYSKFGKVMYDQKNHWKKFFQSLPKDCRSLMGCSLQRKKADA